MDDLEKRVRTIVVERLMLPVAPEALGVGEDLADRYGVDSVRLFDLVVGLEEDFGISFEDQELKLANFATLGDIVARLREKNAR